MGVTGAFFTRALALGFAAWRDRVFAGDLARDDALDGVRDDVRVRGGMIDNVSPTRVSKVDVDSRVDFWRNDFWRRVLTFLRTFHIHRVYYSSPSSATVRSVNKSILYACAIIRRWGNWQPNVLVRHIYNMGGMRSHRRRAHRVLRDRKSVV